MEDHQDGLGLEHLSGERRLRELDLFILEKRWLQGELRASHYPQGSYQEDGARLFTVVCGRKKRDKGCKLKQEMFVLGMKKPHFFTKRPVKQWKSLDREVVQPLCSEAFKTQLGEALSKLV